ncbi:MAG: UDP-N-acetylmuramoyl-L-alanine--D-glutamate ligase [Candidatus Cloacimonadota bacterium]|nr:UDP-N-acetylmuramoyl-L-alanine--D-glutamate ligase [Candidatus Cloacimonadota bacterium]
MFDASRKYAILGLARSGIAAAYKIRELGGTAFLSDAQPIEKISGADTIASDFDCEFGGHSDRLFQCDTWIVSPGIPLNLPIIAKARAKGIELISEIELGFRVKSSDSKVVAVSGSNGKSTTVSLIHHILKNMGYNSILAGNIGSAFCCWPIEKPGIDFIVLEVSSFQLDLIDSFRPDVAVLLNITPDHLDRYASFADYAASKFRLFTNQTQTDTAVTCLDSEPIVERQHLIKSRLLRYSLTKSLPDCEAWPNRDAIQISLRHKLPINELKIRGPHNHANAMAALLTVDALTHDISLAIEAAKSFEPLSHRLEFVAIINGIFFYNDSKATNTDSVRSALTSFDQPIRVIMGGSDKGENFSVLTELLKQRARKVYLTGGTMEKMRAAWEGKLELDCVDDFETCIRAAFADSVPGDIVVLSPACASFDHFRNYEHRGEVFKEIVHIIRSEYEKE